MARFDSKAAGKRLCALRGSRKLTIEEVASGCGLSATYVGLIEKGQRAPGRDALLRLATFFRVSAQFVVSGELQPEDQAKQDRFELWPEIVYVLANHVIVPRRLDLSAVIPAESAIGRAVEEAWKRPHFCDFWDWACSREGRRAGSDFSGRGQLEEIIAKSTGFGSLDHPPSWIGRYKRLRQTLNFEALLCRDRKSGKHRPDAAAACFEADIRASRVLYMDLSFVLLARPPGPNFIEGVFRDEFVKAVFPGVFWSASRRWSDLKIASWISYLGMPLDVFAPLVRTARQYPSPTEFSVSAKSLIQLTKIEDCDVFLGYFLDIAGSPECYVESGAGVATMGGSISVYGEPGRKLVFGRRQSRRASDLHDLIDLVASMDDENKLSEARAAIERIAPPHVFPPTGLLMATDTERRPARAVEWSPPDRLP